MRIACGIDPGRSLEHAVERVRLAEELGYDSAWVSHTVGREPLQLLNHYAHATERIGLGTAVVPIWVRHPALLGMEAATLDEISGGRLSLGIGISHRLTVEGWWGYTLDDPVERMREYTTVLRQMFQRDGSSFEGKHYTSRFGFVGYGARRDLRILWAAMGPRMLRAAAELADGIVLWMCSPGHIRRTIRPVLDEALAEHGRSLEEFDVMASVPVALTEDPGAAREAFRAVAFPYLNLPFYRKEVREAHPDALAAFDTAMAEGNMATALASLDEAFTDDFAGIGDAAAVRAKVGDYRAAGVTLPAVAPLPRHAGSLGVEATLEAAVAAAAEPPGPPPGSG